MFNLLQEIVIKQLERTAFIAVEEEEFATYYKSRKELKEKSGVDFNSTTYTNLFEKELMRLMKDSNYSNVNMIYKKFYAQSNRADSISNLLAGDKINS